MVRPDVEYNIIKANLQPDGWKKLGAIIRILEIGNPTIAQIKELLDACTRVVELETTVGFNTDV